MCVDHMSCSKQVHYADVMMTGYCVCVVRMRANATLKET